MNIRMFDRLRRGRKVDHTGEVSPGVRAMPTRKYNVARARSYRSGFLLGLMLGVALGGLFSLGVAWVIYGLAVSF